MKIDLPCLFQETEASCLAVVVNGFDDDYVSFIDPARGEEIEIDTDTFLTAWDKRGRLGLIIEA